MDVCDMCFATDKECGWYLWDENAEMRLCSRCVSQLREVGESVEPIVEV